MRATRDPVGGGRQREHGGRPRGPEQLDRVDRVGLLEQIDGQQIDPVRAADGLEHRAEGLGGAARVDRVALEGDRRKQLAQAVDRHLRQLGHLHILNAELVGEQQPGPGLAGHDADARCGVRGDPHEPQRLRGVDELRHVVDDHGARLSERGAGHAPAAGESAGVRAREGIDVGAPGLERDDGHVGRELLDRLDEAPAVVDALDRERDDLHRLVVREVAEDVGESDVGCVPEPDAEADAKPLAGREEGERMVDPAALGDDREAACRKIRCRADERRAQPGCGIEEARRVRARGS